MKLESRYATHAKNELKIRGYANRLEKAQASNTVRKARDITEIITMTIDDLNIGDKYFMNSAIFDDAVSTLGVSTGIGTII